MNDNLRINRFHSCDYLGDFVYFGLDDSNLFWIFVCEPHKEPHKEIRLTVDSIESLLMNLQKYGWK